MNITCNNITISIRAFQAEDLSVTESLGKRVFGPGRFARTAFRLREGIDDELSMQYVAEIADQVSGQGSGQICGYVRLTPVQINGRPALMLGPLMVSSEFGKMGIGRELMNFCLEQARAAGHRFVVLVGDMAYYAKFGFKRVPHRTIRLPGPCDPERILMLELVAGANKDYCGTITRKFGAG